MKTKTRTVRLTTWIDEEIDLATKQFFNIWIRAELSEQFRIKLYELEQFARAIEERIWGK